VIKTLAALAFIGLNFYTYHYLASKPVYPDRAKFATFPLTIGDWTCPGLEEMDEKTERNLGVTDYLICRFTSPEYPIGADVYLGYHASQVREAGGGAGENSIHPPAHCLPGAGWDIIDNKNVRLDFPGVPHGPAIVKRLIIAKGPARQLTYYWYEGRGRITAQDWQKIVFVGLDRALRSRTDGALVRFTIPILRNDEASAEEIFRQIAPPIMAELPAYVPE